MYNLIKQEPIIIQGSAPAQPAQPRHALWQVGDKEERLSMRELDETILILQPSSIYLICWNWVNTSKDGSVFKTWINFALLG